MIQKEIEPLGHYINRRRRKIEKGTKNHGGANDDEHHTVPNGIVYS